MPDETLPATQETGALQELPAVGQNLPERLFGSESITDNLPVSVYASVGGLANTLDPDQITKLQEPTPEEEVDIRPDDGAIYVSHEFVRRKLNDVFGFLAWTMVPATPLKSRDRGGKTEWFQKYVLFINGVYVAQAMSSRVLENNPRISLDDVAEMIESNCVVRCCKKLGIALEPWNRRWRDEWRRKWTVAVIAPDWRGNRAKMWRRKDSDALEGEIGLWVEKNQGSAQPKADAPKADAGTKVAQGGNPPSASSANGQAVQETPKADGAATPIGTREAQANAAHKTSTPAPSARGAQPQPTGRGPTASQAQVNMLLARARAAGLVNGEDPTGLVGVLERRGVVMVNTPGKKVMEDLVATLKQVLMKDVNGLLKDIDTAKVSGEEIERI